MVADGKICTKCGEWKHLTEYYAEPRRPAGYASKCKACTKAYSRAYYERPEIKAAASAREKENRKDPEYCERKRLAATEWYSNPENKARAYELIKAYKARPDRAAMEVARKSEWNRSPAGRAYFARRQREVRSTPDGKAANAARKLIARSLEATSSPKSGRTVDLLGYTADQLRDRIACQFESGMSWDNHGEWHIDHKKPIAEFIRQGITDPRTINSLCNLQPLWAPENQTKSDRWTSMVIANDNFAMAA